MACYLREINFSADHKAQQEESINGVRQDHDEADAEEQEAEIPEVWVCL